MILVELEDIQRIHSWSHFNKEAFIHAELTPEEDWEALNDPDWFDKNPDNRYYPGPYLVRVNDEQVWMSRGNDDWLFVLEKFRYVSVEQRQWSAYFQLFANELGLTSRGLLNRYMGIRRRLKKHPDKWFSWDGIYTWSDGADLFWDSLYEHPWLGTRSNHQQKEIRYVSR